MKICIFRGCLAQRFVFWRSGLIPIPPLRLGVPSPSDKSKKLIVESWSWTPVQVNYGITETNFWKSSLAMVQMVEQRWVRKPGVDTEVPDWAWKLSGGWNLQRSCRNDIFDESGAKSSDRSGGQNFDYTRVVTNESWKHWTDASTSGRIGRIGCDYILVKQRLEWDISQIPDQGARQDKRSGMEAQEDSCKAMGNRIGKSPEMVITRNVDQSGELDNNYCCIAKGILKNKSQIELPDRAENWTRLRTGQEQVERRPRSRTEIGWQRQKT